MLNGFIHKSNNNQFLATTYQKENHGTVLYPNILHLPVGYFQQTAITQEHSQEALSHPENSRN